MISSNIIQTGSKGNAVVYNNILMVDCGVSFAKLKGVYRNLKLVLMTHIHKDHIHKKTIKRLVSERPTLRFACCEWLEEPLRALGVENLDVLEVGKLYDYGAFKVSPVALYHDVENCGYRVMFENELLFHATDTQHLDGIRAKGYDLYAIEFNYDADTIQQVIDEKIAKGEYAYEIGAINSHLSFQQAQAFLETNANEKSQVIKLHMSTRYAHEED